MSIEVTDCWKPRLVSRLRELSKRPVLTTRRGAIFAPTVIVTLDDLLLKLPCEETDEESELFNCDPLNLVGELLQSNEDQIGMSYTPYFEMLSAPCNIHFLKIDPNSDTRFVVLEQSEMSGNQFVATIDPGTDAETVSAFVERFLETNGEAFGVEFAGGLPDEVYNGVPELVDETVMRRAFWGLGEVLAKKEWYSWSDVLEGLRSRAEGESHEERARKAMFTALENRWETDWTGDVEKEIFDLWFKAAY